MKATLIGTLAAICLSLDAYPRVSRPLALVYSGVGTCEEGCARAAASVASRAGLKIRYITASQITDTLLGEASVWVQPGGDAITVALALSPEERGSLRQFVYNGGGYVGFCAGAFLADTTVDNPETIPGLGLIPGVSYDHHLSLGKPEILPVLWTTGVRYLYFEDGAAFRLNEGFTGVRAYYPDGAPATLMFSFGMGRVSVTGLHPEAPSKWKKDLEDLDGDDLDLAKEMMNWAKRAEN